MIKPTYISIYLISYRMWGYRPDNNLPLIIFNLLMRTVLLFSLLLLLALANDFSKAKVIGRVGDFLRKRTKFGEIFLHKDHGDTEEVIL